MRDPRNYNWGGLNQAIPDFFFAARRDGAIRALMLNSAYLRYTPLAKTARTSVRLPRTRTPQKEAIEVVPVSDKSHYGYWIGFSCPITSFYQEVRYSFEAANPAVRFGSTWGTGAAKHRSHPARAPKTKLKPNVSQK